MTELLTAIQAEATALTTNGTTILVAIGSAMIALAAVAVLIKWGKASIFG